MEKKYRWKREARYLYPFILKKNGHIVDIRKAIGYYHKYDELFSQLIDDPDCPMSIKGILISVSSARPRMPNYLKWAEAKLVNKIGGKK